MARSVGEKLLTIAELARTLDLPESTTRYYCNRFAEHLPFVGEGRRRRYRPEAAQILKTIAETMRRDKNAYAVDLALRGSEGGAVLPVPPELPPVAAASGTFFAGQVLSLMENQANALREIASAMSVFAERLAVVPGPVQAAGSGPSPISGGEDALKAEIAALREQIRSSEALHQNDLEQLRKWLTRLGEALAPK